MNLSAVAAELLDGLPANRTLGVTITEVLDGIGRAALPVTGEVSNVIGALHSSGVAALADAAALAAALSVSPDVTAARRLQPLGVQARLSFHRPVRGLAVATCILTGPAERPCAACSTARRNAPASRPGRRSTETRLPGRPRASSTGSSGSPRADNGP